MDLLRSSSLHATAWLHSSVPAAALHDISAVASATSLLYCPGTFHPQAVHCYHQTVLQAYYTGFQSPLHATVFTCSCRKSLRRSRLRNVSAGNLAVQHHISVRSHKLAAPWLLSWISSRFRRHVMQRIDDMWNVHHSCATAVSVEFGKV